MSIEEGDAKAREFNVMFIETSAKAGFNIKVCAHMSKEGQGSYSVTGALTKSAWRPEMQLPTKLWHHHLTEVTVTTVEAGFACRSFCAGGCCPFNDVDLWGSPWQTA